MKKLILGIAVLLLGACTSIQTPTNTVVRTSKFIDASVPQTSGNVIYLDLKNKTTDTVEVLLSQSTINNKHMYDGDEIEKVGWRNASASLAGAANSLNYANSVAYGATPQPTLNDTPTDLTNRSADVVLAPGETIRKEVGYQLAPVEYPAWVVLKVRQNGATDFVFINLTEQK